MRFQQPGSDPLDHVHRDGISEGGVPPTIGTSWTWLKVLPIALLDWTPYPAWLLHENIIFHAIAFPCVWVQPSGKLCRRSHSVGVSRRTHIVAAVLSVGETGVGTGAECMGANDIPLVSVAVAPSPAVGAQWLGDEAFAGIDICSWGSIPTRSVLASP